ncbi:sensor histidine kinase [Nesterenkonia sandarakina]|uniref:histidine kinase n=1 Tax=Nesterenkonia sandarakina TaxID=272918 RepID=A0A2T0YH71_9MICC|nr:HAMP domain-containing sensor histidine kinase [Nesterenkonia sandarakina]PRZ14226.1 signal transduction histidine kinase [Nesterenkonia sandarakina]
MASRLTSVRVRTTTAAVAVVAVALVLGGMALVTLLRSSLLDGLETSAEQRASVIADEVDDGRTPTGVEDPDTEPEDEVWQVLGPDGQVRFSSQPLVEALPVEDVESFALSGAESAYLVETDDTEDGSVIAVALSREEVDDSVGALVPLLVLGLPLLLLVVGGTTWLMAGRALAPVERIRAEVDGITSDSLERRVPEPDSRDEVQRLAETMNRMLGRLQHARERQQQFVADASHELRSPLASIRQTAEVARAHPGALGEGELGEAVLEESARMERLVGQLLTLTRADEGALVATPRDVDVDDLALTEGARVRRSGLRVDTHAVAPGRVRGDPSALGQVARNLVDNAVRHAEDQIALAVRERHGTVELVVEDDGRGVAPEDRERVFERFVRLDEARGRDAGGSGLGLAIVAEIVRAHGGTVTVRDGRLGGAAFTVVLPAS